MIFYYCYRFTLQWTLFGIIRQYSTVLYCTVQYSTVQYSTVQCSTVQYSAPWANSQTLGGCPKKHGIITAWFRKFHCCLKTLKAVAIGQMSLTPVELQWDVCLFYFIGLLWSQKRFYKWKAQNLCRSFNFWTQYTLCKPFCDPNRI